METEIHAPTLSFLLLQALFWVAWGSEMVIPCTDAQALVPKCSAFCLPVVENVLKFL
jgi:hypothetical protein